MSDRGREKRFHVDDMIGFARNVQTYTAELDQAEFIADGLTYDATLRNPVPPIVIPDPLRRRSEGFGRRPAPNDISDSIHFLADEGDGGDGNVAKNIYCH